MIYATEGTSFLCVIQYPSGIHRVQHLIAGANGAFFQRHDGTWLHSGTWSRAYPEEEFFQARLEASERNVKQIMEIQSRLYKLSNRLTNIKRYMIGESHGNL